MKMCLLAIAAYVAVATAAASTCTPESLGTAYASAFETIAPKFLSCTKDLGLSAGALNGGTVTGATEDMVDKFIKSPNCVAVYTTLQAASKAVNPPCIIGTMCGKPVTTAQFAAMSLDQYAQASLKTSKCTIPDVPSSASAAKLGIGAVAAGTIALAYL
ncbi:hypothetical protein SPRG_14033 [Saprolegnia parasitica CBS 223.65]|uniref:Secreted protein n=1 Tax=Saprolegnia parasitica (strain CBS 223.65) TaxID=695850 RepID=A0A067C2A4_SAPPC|nr:hypothetical protein SPRG_14033 [Saprolegnia parasitica CBS 223.65]KDO20942.1 hypothetical protein SPRG_14033 [Saprolegnia parasitica CBS 223.65]|eukprot:XP_012208334.1 hypothetical protein SPRG_14033 [Saprolegnia parasitica CBS 223.65]